MRFLTACLFSAFSVCASNAWSNEPACPVAAPEGLDFSSFQKPVVGELAVGFGMRPHPILLMERMHTGVDYAAEAGTPVRASAAGQVVFAAPDGGYGNRVVIAHGNGIETTYGHLLRIDVKKGDCVPQGAVIGAVGSTGLAAGNQLHFEVLRDGAFIDPAMVLAQRQ